MSERQNDQWTLWGTLRLRPLRIGFLIEPHDTAGLQKVLQLCTGLWGGAFNPLIPVWSEVPDEWGGLPGTQLSAKQIALGYIRFFEPDVYVECREGVAASLGIPHEEVSFGVPRTVHIDEFAKFDKVGIGAEFPFGTDIFELYRDRYGKEFQFKRHNEIEIVDFIEDEKDRLFSTAAFGKLPDFGRWTGAQEEFAKAFRVRKAELNAQNFQLYRDKSAITPLSFTRTGLDVQHTDYGYGIVFVVDPESPLDIIDFWNLRLFKKRVIGLSVNWLSSMREWLHTYVINHHRPLRGNPYGVMMHASFQFGRSLAEERVEAALEAAELVKFTNGELITQTWYDPIWLPSTEGRGFRYRRAEVVAQERRIEVTVKGDRTDYHCKFPALYPDFAERFGKSKIRWVNIIKLSDLSAQSNFSILLSETHSRRYRLRMSVSSFVLGSTEGIVIPQQYKEHDQLLSLRDGEDVIIDILSTEHIQAKPSQAGRISRQVIDALGGLGRARLIADKDTIELLDSMAKSRRTHADGSTEDFADRTMEAMEWKTHLHQRSNKSMFKNTKLDDFIKANILRLGLAIKCTNCSMENWYPIGEIGYNNKCERCLRDFEFPQGSMDFKKTPWKYRVIGPFSVPNLAGGAYATVLTLRVFQSGLASGSEVSIVYSPGLDLRGGDIAEMEVDFAFLTQQSGLGGSGGPVCLVFGEAKSFAAEAFQQKDVDRLQKIGAKFPGSFLVFSTLKDQLSDDEKQLIRQLALDGRRLGEDGLPLNPVIILTGFELFAEWRIGESWRRDAGGRDRFTHPSVQFDNLWELARITQAQYLDLEKELYSQSPLPPPSDDKPT